MARLPEHYVSFSINIPTEHFLISCMHVAYFAHPMFLESVTLVIFSGSFSLGIVTVLIHKVQDSLQFKVN
jgi:hypothetical protein